MPCDIGLATTLLWAFISSSKEAGYQLSGVFLRSGFIKEVTGCFQVVLSLQEPGWDGGRGFAGMRVGLVEPIRVLCVCVCVCVCVSFLLGKGAHPGVQSCPGKQEYRGRSGVLGL